tara:strand:+ start:407 stop:799 length:393 start_codon:yes stop_codon:yes gene_type:complete
MYEVIINFFLNIREYLVYAIYGDKHEAELKEIYKKNDIDLNKIYNQLNSINKVVSKEKDFEKILRFLKREIKYENEITNYENILDLEVETPDKIERIALMTNLCDLKRSFENIIEIRKEYYRNHENKKNK